MKILAIFSTALLTLTIGCDNAPAQNNGYGNHVVQKAIAVESEDSSPSKIQSNHSNNSSQNQAPAPEKITMHAVINAQTGQPSMHIPFPESWKMNNASNQNATTVTGPNDLTIMVYPTQTYTYTDIPEMQQAYQANGQQMVPPPGIENLITQQLIPQSRQQGLTSINQYPLPQVAASTAQYVGALYGANNQGNINTFRAMGTEWSDSDGKKVLIVLNYHEMGMANFVNWGYSVNVLKAAPAYFEQAKSAYIYGVSNIAYNQAEINAYNNQLAGKLKADNDQFQANQKIMTEGSRQRLENNRATSEYIRESNQATYDSRTHDNEQLQQQMGNWATDQNTVVSPFDGKEYQVEMGANSYWINDRGDYIKSDDPTYDPNKFETHPGVWKEAPRK